MAWEPLVEEAIEEAEPLLADAEEEIAAAVPEIEAAAAKAAEAAEAAGEKVVEGAESAMESLGNAIKSLSTSPPSPAINCPPAAEAETVAAESEAAATEVEATQGTGAKFADNAKLADHFQRHGGDFGAKSAAEYESQADNFLTGPRGEGVLEKTRDNGDVVRYSPATEEFGVVSKDGTIRTYYEPDPAVHGKPTNLDYFNAQ